MQLEQSTQDIFFPKLEVKNYNVIIDERDFFDQPVKDNINCDRLRGASKKLQ